MSILSMDIGGSKILLAKFVEGEIIKRRQEPTDAHLGREHLLSRIEEMIHSMKEGAEALAVLIPGVVYDNSLVVSCGNLPLENMELKSYLEERTGLPTILGNDVSFALYGEWKKAAPQKKNLVGLFAGSGLGGGLVLDGKLYTGQGAAGEIGHMNYIPHGRNCSCGSRGCYEAYVAKSGMGTRMDEFGKEGGESLLLELTTPGEILDSRDLAKAVKEEDPLALELMESSAQGLAHAIAGLHVLLEPDGFILGGGLVHDLGSDFVELIQAKIPEFMMPAMRDTLSLSMSTLGGDAGIYGGYYLAQEGR